MRKLLYFFLFLVIAIASLLLWYDQSKNYYCLSEDKCITVWKRLGGDCYIISGKYSGWFRPSENYIKTVNNNAVTLLDGKKWNYDFIICNDYGKLADLNFLTQKVKYYDYEDRSSFINEYFIDDRIPSDVNYLMIDIKENLIVLNGVKQ